MTIGAIVLAAGEGRRMGSAKPLVEIAGKPMLRHVLDALAVAEIPVLVVTGAHQEAVAQAAGDVPLAHATDYALGMAHSLRAGLAAVPAHWSGALVVLADMPLVCTQTCRALADALQLGAAAVVPTFENQRGNPAGFSRAAFPALMALSGDYGARPILDRLGAVEVTVDDPGILRDFDRPEDLPD